MRLELIDRVKENEILGKSIFTTDGRILLRAGVELTCEYIRRLKRLGVLYIYVEDERLSEVMIEDNKLNELKSCAMKSMSKIIKNVSNADKYKVKESLNVVENLVQYILENGDVNLSLNDIKTYDNYTYVHSLDTCIMAAFMGKACHVSQDGLKELGIAAILHDIGKTRISTDIICKEGSLTDEEFEEIKKHPTYGAEMLQKNIRISDATIRAVAQHHERVDGKGYPLGLKNRGISKFAKIISICDVYDAVSNDRCYRKKFNPNDAYELILSGSGTYFDEKLVLKFKNTFSIYPLGVCLRLSNGVEGYVIRQNENFPDRPVIRVLYDANTQKPVPFYEVDLLKNINITVECVVN